MYRDLRGFGTVIIGGGPAGVAVLLAACRHGKIEDLLERGLAVIEAGPAIGAGKIGGYFINSDSTAATFIDCLKHSTNRELRSLLDHPAAREMSELGQGAVPLPAVGRLMLEVGKTLESIISHHPGCAVYTLQKATRIQQCGDGGWRTRVRQKNGDYSELTSDNIVMATGASQPLRRLKSESVGGCNIYSRYGKKLLQSADILKMGGVETLMRRLPVGRKPKIAILGGSTSAVAVAHTLLTRLPAETFGDAGLSLLHRRELRIYYPSAEEALAEDYKEFGADDICPVSNRVFRFAGLRLDSRELIMRARGIGGRPAEPRLYLHHLRENDERARQIMDGADIVIAALGYRPKALRVVDKKNRTVRLFANTGANAPLVDGKCQVLDAHEKPLHGLFGIGLAAGFVPRGALGGEPSFSGQANGLWLWQTAVGAMIVEALLANAPQNRAAPPRIGRDEMNQKLGAPAAVTVQLNQEAFTEMGIR